MSSIGISVLGVAIQIVLSAAIAKKVARDTVRKKTGEMRKHNSGG